MRLKLQDDSALPLRVHEVEEVESRHTGRTLRVLSVSTGGRVSPESHEAILATLKEDSVETLGDEAQVSGVWEPKLRSHSSTGDNRSYAFDLAEKEDIQPTLLRVGDLELTPYRYQERPSGDSEIMIDCRAKTTPEQTEALFDLMASDQQWFEVVREGVSETPRPMRFGGGSWSDHGEYHKHDLLLVERPSEGEEAERPFRMSDEAARAYTAYGLQLTDVLLEKLVESGVLTEDDVEALRSTAQRKYHRRIRDMELVDDVDRWD